MPIPSVPSPLQTILAAKTYNAAWFPGDTIEAQIQNAITSGVNDNVNVPGTCVAVFVPANMYPYDASLITFNTSIKMTRENGDPAQWDVLAYGGTTAASAAIQAAYNGALAHGGGVVFIPAGFYTLTAGIDIHTTPTGVIFQGEGRNVTHLAIGVNGIAAFDLTQTVTRLQIRDMWIGSFSARPSGFGFRAISVGTQHSEIHIDRVTFQNLPSAIYMDNVSGVVLTDCRYLQTIATATVNDVMYLIRCNGWGRVNNFNMLATAGSFGRDGFRIDSDCDTVVFENCEFALAGNGPGVGFHFMNSVGGASTGPRLCRATDCYAENFNQGFLIEDARDVKLNHCHTANNTIASYGVTGGDSITLDNCLAYGNQQHGYSITGGKGVHMIGCTAMNNGQQTDNTYDGLVLSNANTTRIVACRFGDVITTFTNKQRRGMSVTTAGHIITDNDLQGNKTTGFNDSSGGRNYLRGNKSTAGDMQGTVALNNGTVTVNNVEIRAGDTVLLTRIVGAGTTRGILTLGAIVANTSFVVRAEDLAGALSADDDSTFFWEIVH